MKRLICYLSALFLMTACMFDLDKLAVRDTSGASVPEKSVMITFSVPGVRLAPSTKSLEDGDGDITDEAYLDPDKLFLVVCGGTQSIKYVRKAEVVLDENGQPLTQIIPKSELEDIGYPLAEGESYPDSIKLYTFRVQLEVSDSRRTIHFLGNIDENQLITGSYSYQILPFLLSFEGKQAYWQKLVTSIMTDDTGIDPETGCYTPDEATIANFKYVPLIRNFAEIQIVNIAQQFKLYSYAVIFTPKQGSVVPYRHNLPSNAPPDSCFTFTTDRDYRLSGYEKCTIEDLESADKFNYQGNLPTGVAFTGEADIPSVEDFLHPENSNGTVLLYDKNATHGFYVYEREVPTDANPQPTFIILCGKGLEKDEDPDADVPLEELLFYRMDLIDSKKSDVFHTADYYPIFRNFRYEILLDRVTSAGVSDPVSAYKSTGAEDISADLSMKSLSDISNGRSRLVVDPFMARTFTGPEKDTVKLYVRFYDDVTDATPNTNDFAVMVTLESMEDGGDDIVTLYNDAGVSVRTSFPVSQVKQGEDGWRIVRFNLKKMPGPDDPTRTQIIKITGRNSQIQEEFPLYREVEITLQRMQEMVLSCTESIEASRGMPQTLSISIPDSLKKSMFPLDFIIETDAMTLTPISGSAPGNNLPVKPGKSLAGNDKNTFQFIRTLTWDEYASLVSSADHKRTFQCFFKTTRNESATTIRVANVFFNPAAIPFENEHPPRNHFYVQAGEEEGCIVRMFNSNLQYRIYELKEGEWAPLEGVAGQWTSFDNGADVPIGKGQRAAFKYAGSGNLVSWSGGGKFFCRKPGESNRSAKNGTFKVGGNIASLIAGDRYPEEGQDINQGISFSLFFKEHIGLTDASELVLPMLTGQSSCYKSMFEGCTSLVSGPARLPATKINTQCYQSMFKGCVNLKNAPVLVDAQRMNNSGQYANMFEGCSSLEYIVFLGSTWAQSSFTSWVSGVAPQGVFVVKKRGNAIEAAGQGVHSIPSGWDVRAAE